jgi:hypothetical protein
MPVRQDIDALVTLNSSIGPQTIASNTTVNGASTDMRAFHEARVYVICSVGTRTDGSYLFIVQDSADNSSFATLAVFSGALTATAAADTDKTAAVVPVTGRPFIRVSVTSSAVTTGASVAANLVIVPAALA